MAPAKKGGRAKGEARTPRSYPALRRQGVAAPAGTVASAGIAEARCRTDPARGPISRQAGGAPQGARVWFVARVDGLLRRQRRADQARQRGCAVIATSTTVDLSSVPIHGLKRRLLRAEKANIGEKDDNFFSAQAGAARQTSDERKKDQKAIDDKLLKVIEKTPMLKAAWARFFTRRRAEAARR